MRLPAFNPHPEVVLLVVAMLGAYLWALRTLGPSRVLPGEPAATRAQRVSFVGGVATLFVAAWWPMHDLAERYLYSIHMVEHLLIMLVAPPLLLFGMPAWLLRWVLQARLLRWIVRHLARPFVGLVLFNAVLVLSHWPAVVTLSVQNEWFHFGAHTVLFCSALLMWWPVLSPLPEMPTLSYPGRMLYLFLQSIVPTVPASILTFGSTLLYKVYGTFPRIWGLSALTDQRIAGLTMKLAGGAILWALIAVVFFKWYGQENTTEGWDAMEWRKVEREIGRELSRPAPAVKEVEVR